MLNDDESHAGIVRQFTQQFLDRFQATCGGTDPDYTKRRFSF
jgi:hypothetical protein